MMQTKCLRLCQYILMMVACLSWTLLAGGEISLTAHARLLAGMQASQYDKQAFRIENSQQWQEAAIGRTAAYFWDLEEWEGGRKNQLNKKMGKRSEIELFLSKHLQEAYFNTRNVLYLFGGPDFCYPDLFFPNMETLILVGMEKIESYPNVKKLRRSGTLSKVMFDIGTSLAQIPFRSYFVTQTMNEEFSEYGVTTLLAVGIALTDYQIVSCEKIFLDEEGRVQPYAGDSFSPGVKIAYKKEAHDTERTVYYFAMNLFEERNFLRLSHFVQNKGIDTAFYKATSFATQLAESVNQLALNHAHYIVQGESGIPFSQFDPALWNIKLFGIYARPYHSTQNIPPSWGLQPDLRDIYIALIRLNGSPQLIQQVKMIWGDDVYSNAAASIINPHVVWDGIVPIYFDYGGQLTEIPLRSFTSAMQYARRK